MGLFKKKTIVKTYDKDNKKPVIKASICNGEQVAGFKDIRTGKIEEVMLIKSPSDIDIFKKMYGIDDEIAKEFIARAFVGAKISSINCQKIASLGGALHCIAWNIHKG